MFRIQKAETIGYILLYSIPQYDTEVSAIKAIRHPLHHSEFLSQPVSNIPFPVAKNKIQQKRKTQNKLIIITSKKLVLLNRNVLALDLSELGRVKNIQHEINLLPGSP